MVAVISLVGILANVNIVQASIPTSDITATNTLIYSAATIVLDRMNIKVTETEKKQWNSEFVPVWKVRLSLKLKWLRIHLSQLIAYSHGRLHRHHLIDKLFMKYHISDTSQVPVVIESLKQQVIAISKRIARYTSSQSRKFDNCQFRKNQKLFFRQLNGNATPSVYPSSDECREMLLFWEQLWSIEIGYNKNTE